MSVDDENDENVNVFEVRKTHPHIQSKWIDVLLVRLNRFRRRMSTAKIEATVNVNELVNLYATPLVRTITVLWRVHCTLQTHSFTKECKETTKEGTKSSTIKLPFAMYSVLRTADVLLSVIIITLYVCAVCYYNRK